MASNLTFLEDDPFLDYNEEIYRNATLESYTFLRVFYGIFELLKFIICLVSLGAAIFLVYVLKKFDKLKNQYNDYLLHFAIAVIIDIASLPVCELILILMRAVFHFNVLGFYFCGTHQIWPALFCLKVLLTSSMVVFWYLNVFKTEWPPQKIIKYKTFSIGLSYLISFIYFVIAIGDCLTSFQRFSDLLVGTLYVTALISVIYVDVLSMKKILNTYQLKTKYHIIIGSYVVFSYFPIFLVSVEMSFETDFWFVQGIFYFISEFIMYLDCTVVVFLLGYYDKYFKMAYRSVFKCGLKRYNQDNLDEDSDLEDNGNVVIDTTEDNTRINLNSN